MPPIVRELQGRPLVLLAIALGLGLSAKASPWHALAFVPLLALCPTWVLRGCAASVALLGVLLAPMPAKPLPERQYVDLDFNVVSAPRTGRGGDWCIAESRGIRLGVFLGQEEVSLGDTVHLKGTVSVLREGSETFWLSKGVVASFFVGEFNQLEIRERGSPIFRWGLSWRKSFIGLAESSMSREQAQIANALCFNLDALLDPSFQGNLQRTGTVHIVSASGLHVMIFAVAFQLILARMPIPRSAQLVLLLFILLIYAGATGFRPPVFRSVVMVGVMMSAYLVRREGDLLSAAGLAAIVQLLIDPRAVADIGFYLSFLTVGALALYMGHDFGQTWLERVKNTAKGSLVASLASAPIVGYVFGQVSLIAILANVLIAPAIPIIVAGGLLFWALSLVSAGLAAAGMAYVVGPACSYCEWLVNTLGPLSISAVEIPAYSPYWIPAFYVVCLGFWQFRRRLAG